MRLAGKVAIISGAESGMGAATARIFAREGAKVVIADVLEYEGRQLADGIPNSQCLLRGRSKMRWRVGPVGHLGQLERIVVPIWIA